MDHILMIIQQLDVPKEYLCCVLNHHQQRPRFVVVVEDLFEVEVEHVNQTQGHYFF